MKQNAVEINVEASVNVKPMILMVDDDEFVLRLLAATLHAEDFDTCSAQSAAEALRIIETAVTLPDLIVLDISMPGMSGIDLARLMHSNSSVPIMFMSASIDKSTVQRAADYGAVGYLVKPLVRAHVIPAVIAALARSAELRKLRTAEARLNDALERSRETGIAVGLLMERFRIDSGAAYRALRDQARARQQKLVVVVRELIDHCDQFNAFGARRQ